jgi:hypothetical protein
MVMVMVMVMVVVMVMVMVMVTPRRGAWDGVCDGAGAGSGALCFVSFQRIHGISSAVLARFCRCSCRAARPSLSRWFWLLRAALGVVPLLSQEEYHCRRRLHW